MTAWAPFPYDHSGFIYAGDSLKKHWEALHSGDGEAYPDEALIKGRLEAAESVPGNTLGDDTGAIAQSLRQAWRHYHAGEFQQALEAGERCGLLGHAVCNKATGIYATYLEEDDAERQALYADVLDRASAAAECFPDDANAWYFQAFALGRQSQAISVAKALKQGVGGKIRKALDQTLELAPDHAEAHTALGLYHAEIIDKVGKLIGGMTYGASADAAIEHFQQSLSLTPDAPIAHVEYGNGLYLLYGDKKIDEVTDAYIAASELSPIDAMQRLDIQLAADELE